MNEMKRKKHNIETNLHRKSIKNLLSK